jgi:hypothetical protein
MKKEIQIFKIPPRQNIKGLLRGILKKDKSVISEIQIKELTNG